MFKSIAALTIMATLWAAGARPATRAAETITEGLRQTAHNPFTAVIADRFELALGTVASLTDDVIGSVAATERTHSQIILQQYTPLVYLPDQEQNTITAYYSDMPRQKGGENGWLQK